MNEDQIVPDALAEDLPAKKTAYVDLAAISARERGKGFMSSTLPGGIIPIWYLLVLCPIAHILFLLGIRTGFVLNLVTVGDWCVIIYLACLTPVVERRFRNYIGFPCTHCDKHLSTGVYWICGYCNSLHNPNGPRRSFERPCSECKRLAKGYRCFHCGKTVCLDATCDERNPAYAAYEKYPEAMNVDLVEQSRSGAENTINKLIADKAAFSMITEKVCELRDTAIKKINDSELDPDTKRTRLEFERQWAKTWLESIKMQAIRARK